MANNYFAFKQFTIYQDMCAMKVGTDGTLLGAWATPDISGHVSILDVGTGTGLIAIMMAQRYPDSTVTGIEIDRDAAIQAEANVAASPFAGRIKIMNIPLQVMKDEIFDLIVCNPPYFTNSLKCPDERRSTARHSTTLTYNELASQAARLLGDAGILSVIIPADSKYEMDSAAAIAGLHPRSICTVRTKPEKPVKRYMLSYSTTHNKDIEDSEIIINDDEYKKMLKDFYLAL